MIQTPFGPVKITINGEEYNYKEKEMPLTNNKNFWVDGRYAVYIEDWEPVDGEVQELACWIESDTPLEGGDNSGQYFEFNIYEKENMYCGIGTFGEVKDTGFKDIIHGIKVITPNVQKTIFLISWLSIDDSDKGYIRVNLACDPMYIDEGLVYEIDDDRRFVELINFS